MGFEKKTAKQNKEDFKYPVDYYTWLEEERNCPDLRILNNRYDSVAQFIQRSYQQSVFWQTFIEKCDEFDFNYKKECGYPLFRNKPDQELLVKPFDSFIEKTFRTNVLNNNNFPHPPTDDWLTPENWFSRIHDIIRTKVVCNYVDGVIFLSGQMKLLHEKLCGESCKVDFIAYNDGYYAAHINLSAISEVPSERWDTTKIETQCEIQITSQLHDFVKELLHNSYNKRRMNRDTNDVTWQWDIDNKLFETNFLGHFLQYFDVKIYEIRKKAGGQSDGREN